MRKKTGEVRRLLAETLKVEEMLAKKKTCLSVKCIPTTQDLGEH